MTNIKPNEINEQESEDSSVESSDGNNYSSQKRSNQKIKIQSREPESSEANVDDEDSKNKLTPPKTIRGQKTFTKWTADENESDDLNRNQQFKKENSNDDIVNRKFFHNFKRQFTQLVEDNPPLPLLPKSMIVRSESPKSGGIMNFLKLTKFRGQDYGKS